jgi:hypothetical protein
LPAYDGLDQVITLGWPTLHEKTKRSRDRIGRVTPLAEILKVREAHGGICWAQQSCRAHPHRRAARLCHAEFYVAGRRIVVGLRKAARGGFFVEGVLSAWHSSALKGRLR